MKRILIFVACVTLLVCAFALPASAAVLDYNDYITSISVSGDDDHITLKFPGFGMWNLHETLSYHSLNKYTNSSLEFPRYYPLMDSSGTSNAFLRSDFPDDTSFAFSFKANTQNSPSAGYLNVRQFDSSGSYIGLITVDLTLNVSRVDSVWNVLTTFYMNSIDFNPSCHTFYFDFEFYTEGIPSQLGGTDTVYWYYFDEPSFILNLTINSLLRQQQLSNKQNAILNAVEKQLAENGQTLDEVLQQQQQTNDKLDSILNGKPLPSKPTEDSEFDSLYDQEDAIKDEISSGFDEAERVHTSAIQVLHQYVGAFAVVAWIFNLFADLGLVKALLYVSMALGVFAVLLGVVPTVVRSVSNSPGKE